MWLHRRGEEPSTTSVECYWKKSALSEVGKYRMDFKSVFQSASPPPQPNPSGAQYIAELQTNVEGAISTLSETVDGRKDVELSVWQLFRRFTAENNTNNRRNSTDFMTYMSRHMSDHLCAEIEEMTKNQSTVTMWYEMRFGRITASKLNESAQCGILRGSLTEALMGATTVPETAFIKRGKILEPEVLLQVQALKNIKIKKCGLLLRKEFPIFGASPDGLSQDFCIEVKCPASEETMTNYIKDDKIQAKYDAQLQLQMFFAHKTKGLFCVAAPDFEKSRIVQIIEVTLQREKILQVMEKAKAFWEQAIFPLLQEIY